MLTLLPSWRRNGFRPFFFIWMTHITGIILSFLKHYSVALAICSMLQFCLLEKGGGGGDISNLSVHACQFNRLVRVGIT